MMEERDGEWVVGRVGIDIVFKSMCRTYGAVQSQGRVEREARKSQNREDFTRWRNRTVFKGLAWIWTASGMRAGQPCGCGTPSVLVQAVPHGAVKHNAVDLKGSSYQD